MVLSFYFFFLDERRESRRRLKWGCRSFHDYCWLLKTVDGNECSWKIHLNSLSLLARSASAWTSRRSLCCYVAMENYYSGKQPFRTLFEYLVRLWRRWLGFVVVESWNSLKNFTKSEETSTRCSEIPSVIQLFIYCATITLVLFPYFFPLFLSFHHFSESEKSAAPPWPFPHSLCVIQKANTTLFGRNTMSAASEPTESTINSSSKAFKKCVRETRPCRVGGGVAKHSRFLLWADTVSLFFWWRANACLSCVVAFESE